MRREVLDATPKLAEVADRGSAPLDEAIRMGDRIAILREGKVVQNDTP